MSTLHNVHSQKLFQGDESGTTAEQGGCQESGNVVALDAHLRLKARFLRVTADLKETTQNYDISRKARTASETLVSDEVERLFRNHGSLWPSSAVVALQRFSLQVAQAREAERLWHADFERIRLEWGRLYYAVTQGGQPVESRS